MSLEKQQHRVAAAAFYSAVTSSPAEALKQLESHGVANRLGPWSWAVDMLKAAPADAPMLVTDPRSSKILDNADADDSLADAAHDLHKTALTNDLAQRIAAAQTDLASGQDPAATVTRLVRALAEVKDGRKAASKDCTLSPELVAIYGKSVIGDTPVAKAVSTGFSSLDSVIFGWQPTLNLIGADPGVGKSAFLAGSIYHMARAGHKVLVFSLEDPPSWVAMRLVSRMSGVPVLRLMYSVLSSSEREVVGKAIEELGKISDRIMVIDGSDRPMSATRLVFQARQLIGTEKVACVMVDHAGELKSTERDRHDLEVSSQLAELRGLANETGVPVVVAMHMRRRVTGGPPRLSDFANSSGAERKARLALGLSREAGSNMMSVGILKQTNGPAGGCVDLEMDVPSGTVL